MFLNAYFYDTRYELDRLDTGRQCLGDLESVAIEPLVRRYYSVYM